MLPDPTIYPRFVANQLLTEKSLNDMVTYFDSQVRDSRIYLIGLGIFYGLDLTISNANGEYEISVSKGMGVSSQGFLFKLENSVSFKSYSKTILPKNKLLGNTCGDSSSSSSSFDVYELEESSSDLLTSEILQNKVVVLYCEESDENQSGADRCINELNESGISVTTTIKAILMEKTDVDGLISEGGNNSQNSDFAPLYICLLYTSPSPRDATLSRMPSSA